MIACCTGRCKASDRGYAALFAKEMGRNVSAPNVDVVGTLYADKNGKINRVDWSLEYAKGSSFTGEKKWNYFTPSDN